MHMNLCFCTNKITKTCLTQDVYRNTTNFVCFLKLWSIG